MTRTGAQELGPYTEGEIPAPLAYEFQDADGTPLDLTGYSAVFLHSPSRDAEVIVTPSTLDGAVATHVWEELSIAGIHHAEFWVGNGTNRFASDRFRFMVRRAIDIPDI